MENLNLEERFNLAVDKELYEKLRFHAYQKRRSMAEITRQALINYFEKL